MLNWLLTAELHFGSKAILWREIIGNLFGLSSALLGMRRKVWSWPIGIIGNALLFTVFMGGVFANPQDKNLYGQSGRQVLFIIVSIYGWIQWTKAKNLQSATPPVVPRWTTLKEKLVLAPITLVFFVASYLILKELGSWGPVADAAIFTGSALATYGLAKGYIEFWLAWIAVDSVGLPLLLKGGFYPTAAMYAFYGAFVIWGFINWLRLPDARADRSLARVGRNVGVMVAIVLVILFFAF